MYIQVALVLRKYKYNFKKWKYMLHLIFQDNLTHKLYHIPKYFYLQVAHDVLKDYSCCSVVNFNSFGPLCSAFFVPFTSYVICVAYRLGSHYTHFLVNSVNHVYKIFSDIEWPCNISVFGGILCHSHLWLIQKYSASLWLYRNGTEDHLQLK